MLCRFLQLSMESGVTLTTDTNGKKLSVCADFYGYDWGQDKAHDSLSDCRATLYCYHKIKENYYE